MRKKFYLRAGYEEAPVQYEWRQENYEILSIGGQISEAEQDGFCENLHAQAEQQKACVNGTVIILGKTYKANYHGYRRKIETAVPSADPAGARR